MHAFNKIVKILKDVKNQGKYLKYKQSVKHEDKWGVYFKMRVDLKHTIFVN